MTLPPPTPLHPTKNCNPGPVFPKPQPSNEGNPGRHIFPHDRMEVLLTIPGQLEAPTRRIDQGPTDNKIG